MRVLEWEKFPHSLCFPYNNMVCGGRSSSYGNPGILSFIQAGMSLPPPARRKHGIIMRS